jgi:hypothetical protein
MSNFNFKFKRVVLVDSADLCYAELPLDEHAILLGKGNIGKSSILNSLRLFLLPEVNFAKAESKFAFRTSDKNSYYTKDESFNHYFPSPTSFLILEVENFTGSHCQILSKGTGYQYNRLFVPLAYDQIRDLFWSEGDDEDGIGQAIEGLSFASVSQKIKKRAPKTVSANDTEKLKQLLYASNFLNDDETRYSLFPLVEQDSSKVNSLKALFLLLFDMNSNSEAMAMAIANIIEADKKSSNDMLNFNIDDFLSRHEELETESHHLNRIRNKERKYESLLSTYTHYRQLSEADIAYAHFSWVLKKQKASTLAEKSEVDKSIAPVLEKTQRFSADCDALKRQIANMNVQITSRQSDLREAKSELKKAEKLQQHFYSDVSIEEAVKLIEAELTELDKALQATKDDAAADKRRKELTVRVTEYSKELTRLKDSAKNKEYLLTEQLSASTSDVLAAVNKRLLQANPQRQLKPQEVEAIEQFTTLFKDQGTVHEWYDIAFGKQSKDIFDDLDGRVADLTRLHDKANNELQKLQQPTNSLSHQKDIQDLETKVSDLTSTWNSLKRHPFATANLEDYQQKLSIHEIDQKNLVAQLTIVDTSWSEAKQALAELQPKQEAFIQRLGSYVTLEKTCDRLVKHYPRVSSIDAEKQNFSEDLPLTATALDNIETELRQFDVQRLEIIGGLKDFIAEGVIEDECNIRVDSPSSSDIKQTFSRLEEIFNELPQKQAFLSEQIVSHNQSVSHYTKSLTTQAEHIKAFTNQLNRDFSTIQINDLEQVEVTIEIDQRFNSLVAEINSADFHGEEMLSKNFYDRLKVFVNSFFGNNNNDSRLTMDKIVKGLHYRIKKQGKQTWQTKKQSNSTTSLINLQLAQILLNRIKKKGASVVFPLVHDELADISIDQFDWLLPHLTKNDFRLFSAATYSVSTELIRKVGQLHEIGSMRTSRAYSEGRTIVYWKGAEQFTDAASAKASSAVFAEQSELELADK